MTAIGAAEAAIGTAGLDGELDAIAGRIGALSVEAAEAARDLHRYLDRLEADPARLEQCEERLDAIDRLKRKHGGSIEAVLGHAERCRERIAELESASERGAELESRLDVLLGERKRLGGELNGARREAARSLEPAAAAELERLAMDGARLEVVFEPDPDGFGPWGAERVELRVATNPGMPPAPLRDAASGGELSRVMLALSSLASGGPGTIVFDEIDAGIGGTTANAVGDRLRAIGAEHQVICITHLPQVASQADANFVIAKRSEDGAAVATVERVEDEALVAEITRMMGADVSDGAAGRHARELLEAA